MKVNWKRAIIFSLPIILAGFFVMGNNARADEVRNMIFPVLGDIRYSNDFGAPRVGHTHAGIDVMGYKHEPLLAAVDGLVRFVAYPEPYYGYSIFLEDEDGYEYWYLHINNDNPGTDDGLGGGINAYAPDIVRGNPVVAGQTIGYMGDSGNAESTVDHLHFEIHQPDGTVINPFLSLQVATRIGYSVPGPKLDNEILPFGEYKGGASIAYGELHGGYTGEEIIVGAGPGGGPQVSIYAQNGTLIGTFFAWPETFRGGVNVAAGDFNGDGIDEIIAAVATNGGPQVRIFTADAKLRSQFMAYDSSFRGGLSVASADLTGDGIAEIITGSGPGSEPLVRVFNSDGQQLSEFMAYADTFDKGFNVSATEATEATPALIATGAGIGGGPHVRVFDMDGELHSQFFAYAPEFRGGVNVDIGNIDTKSATPEIITSPASGGGAQFRLFSHRGTHVKDYSEYETWWRGGYDVASGYGSASVVTSASSRRTSVRDILN